MRSPRNPAIRPGLAAVLLLMVALAASAISVAAQTPAGGTEMVKAFIASRVQKNWTAPQTPWGDPDISGVFTTKDEANTPFERPDEWAGRRMDDITPQEFAEALQERSVPFARTQSFDCELERRISGSFLR